ncbi:MAG: HdeD family acid-resistance protein [Cyclobacteriaceae bacterium]
MVISLFKNWWWLTVNGVAAIVFGLIALLYPEMTLLLMLLYFGLLALFLGAFFIMGGLLNRKETSLWDFWVFEGILNGVIGLILLFYTQVSVAMFMMLLAVWAFLMAAIQIISVVRLWSQIPHKWTYIVNGLLAFIFGIVVIINPFESAIAITRMVGISAIILGTFSIIISLRMREIRKDDLAAHTKSFRYHHG